MLCDDCGRNEATVHIVQIGPDGRVEKIFVKNVLLLTAILSMPPNRSVMFQWMIF